jgi:L-glyceraldehyde 3-phosphate reductase
MNVMEAIENRRSIRKFKTEQIPEDKLLKIFEREGLGCIVFSPLAQGLLSDKYLNGIPEDSRAASPHGFLRKDQITDDKMEKIHKLNSMAHARDQSLAQMAIAWV